MVLSSGMAMKFIIREYPNGTGVDRESATRILVELDHSSVEIRQSTDGKSWSIHPVQVHGWQLKPHKVAERGFFVSKTEAVGYAKLILAVGKLDNIEKEYQVARDHLRTARANRKLIRQAVKTGRKYGKR